MNIPFYVLNCEKTFKEKVIDPFVEDYLSGTTPIPCTNCNTFLKFHYLVKKMEELECDYLATGHYAEVKPLERGGYGIFTSQDDLKDQTWFLFTLPPELLAKAFISGRRNNQGRGPGHLQRQKICLYLGKKNQQAFALLVPEAIKVLLKVKNRSLKKGF